MADQTLPTTGENTKVELVVDGVPMKVIDSVVSFSESAQYKKVESEHLGTHNVDLNNIPNGWSGELEVSRRDGSLDDFIDAYNAARRARLPVLITIVNTKLFENGTSRTHTYPDVKVDFETRQTRGQNVTTRLPWRCGVERIAT